MIIDGVMIGVALAALELGVAWILACVVNYKSTKEQKKKKMDNKNVVKFTRILPHPK